MLFGLTISFLVVANSAKGICNRIVVCDGDSMILACKDNATLVIEEANYGREEPDVCITDRRIDLTCTSSSALNILKRRCDSTNACNVMVSDAIFGKECNAEKPYLNVYYFCNLGTSDELSTTQGDGIMDTSNDTISTSSSTRTVFKTGFYKNGIETVVVSSTTTNTEAAVDSLTTEEEPIPALPDSSSGNVKICECNIHSVLSNIDLLQRVSTDDIIEKIAVDKRTLSKTRRRLTSAADDRGSAAVVGYVAILVIVVIIVTIMISDVATFLIGPKKVAKKT